MWRRQPWPQRGDGSPDVSFTLRLAGDYSRPLGTTSTKSSVRPATPIEPPTSYSPWNCTNHSTRLLRTSPTHINPSPSLCPTLNHGSFIPHRRKSSLPLKWTFEAHDSSTLTGPCGANRNCSRFPDMYVCCTKSCVLQGLPLRCSLTAAICAQGSCRNESASSSGDRAGDSQSVEGKGDKYEPERRVLFASD